MYVSVSTHLHKERQQKQKITSIIEMYSRQNKILTVGNIVSLYLFIITASTGLCSLLGCLESCEMKQMLQIVPRILVLWTLLEELAFPSLSEGYTIL